MSNSEVHATNSTDSEAEDGPQIPQEEKEWGWGVYNIDRQCFIPKLDLVDPEVYSREEAIEHFCEIDVDSKRHLRVVRVIGDTEATEEAKQRNSDK